MVREKMSPFDSPLWFLLLNFSYEQQQSLLPLCTERQPIHPLCVYSFSPLLLLVSSTAFSLTIEYQLNGDVLCKSKIRNVNVLISFLMSFLLLFFRPCRASAGQQYDQQRLSASQCQWDQ